MNNQFVWRRLHSLTGIFPVGIFLVYHLYLQLYLHSGAEAYNQEVNQFYDSPLAIWTLVFFVYLPLFFHSLYGVRLCFEAQVQPQYQYFSHVLYWLQRVSGVGVFLFVLGHLWNAKVMPWIDGTTGAHYEHLYEGFHSDTALVTKTVYLLGVLGAAFHFSNGVNTFCITWGIALTPRAQLRVRNFSIGLFTVLTISTFYALTAIW